MQASAHALKWQVALILLIGLSKHFVIVTGFGG